MRVVVRSTPSGRQIEEFTAFGIQVLKSYKAALEKGDRAAELMLAEARAKYPEPPMLTRPVTVSADEKPANVRVEVESGNHKVIVTPPLLPKSYSLEGLRHIESVEIDDPLTLATQFLEIADQVQAAMQQDIDQREQKLQRTRQAKNTIAAKAQELKLEKRLYQQRSDQLGAAQTEETQSLQEALSTLQTLGKPTADASMGSS